LAKSGSTPGRKMIAMKIAAVGDSRFPEADLEQGRPLGPDPDQIKDEGIRACDHKSATTIGWIVSHPGQVAIVELGQQLETWAGMKLSPHSSLRRGPSAKPCRLSKRSLELVDQPPLA